MRKIIGVLLILGSLFEMLILGAQHQCNPFIGVLLLLVLCFGWWLATS